MKKAILILTLLLICTFSSNAQNDASWEETIDFIERKISWLNHSSSNGFSSYTAKCENEILIISEHYTRNDNSEFTRKYHIDFTIVSNIKEVNCGFLILTKSSFIAVIKEDGNEEKLATPQCSIDYDCEIESNAKRILNAFNHLLFLSSQKDEKF